MKKLIAVFGIAAMAFAGQAVADRDFKVAFCNDMANRTNSIIELRRMGTTYPTMTQTINESDAPIPVRELMSNIAVAVYSIEPIWRLNDESFRNDLIDAAYRGCMENPTL